MREVADAKWVNYKEIKEMVQDQIVEFIRIHYLDVFIPNDKFSKIEIK